MTMNQIEQEMQILSDLSSAGTEVDYSHGMSCCSKYSECAKYKRCICNFYNDKNKVKCNVLEGLKIGKIYMSKDYYQEGIMGDKYKVYYSNIFDGKMQVRYVVGKNRDDKVVYVVYVWFAKDWMLLTSYVPRKKVTMSRLNRKLEHDFKKSIIEPF